MSERNEATRNRLSVDWAPLAGDLRAWLTAHMLSVKTVGVFIALNFAAWVVAAMAGRGFRPRLDTSMAEFDVGKLALSLVFASGALQLVIDALLLLVMWSIAERWLGRSRAAAVSLVCALAGAAVGIVLCAGIGWAFGDSQLIARMRFTLSPLTLGVGALLGASAYGERLWRRRIRLIGYTAILVGLLYRGNPGDYCILAAALIGQAIGWLEVHRHAGRAAAKEHVTATETEGPTIDWHWARSTSFEIRRMLAAIGVVLALGPVVAITSHTHVGPLSTLGLLMSPAEADGHMLAQCLGGAARQGCFLQFNLLRASMPGAVLRSLLPTAVMLVLAYGMYRGRRFAALATVVVNLCTTGIALAYYLVLPLAFTPGGLPLLARHGAIVSGLANALPPLVFAILLALAMRHFPVRLGWRRLLGGAGAIVTAFLACAAVYLLYGLSNPRNFTPTASAGDLLAELPGRFLPIGFLSHVQLAFMPRTPMASVVYQGVGLVFWIAVLAVVLRWMRDVTVDNEQARARAARMVEAGGESMSFMTTWEGNEYWMLPTGRSAVAYRVINGVALTCTGPFGDRAEWRDDLAGFARFCAERSWSPVFYSVHRGQRDMLREMGWQSIEVGGEMVVDPRQWKTSGKKWQDIRTAINKARREGVTDVRSTFLEAPAQVCEQIEEISEEWAQLKALPEMRFTLGGVQELRDPRVQLLYAVDADGRVLGVTSWLPTWRDGRVIGWTLDFMRHRPDSPNGVMEFLIARMAERLRDEGQADPDHAVEFMSLSAAPLAGMDPERDNADGTDGIDGGSRDSGVMVIQHALQVVADLMEPAYGFRSLFNFKRKFQPSEEPVYVCYPDPALLARIGLAVVRAYVPTVTSAEVSGMLRTLRSDEKNGGK